MINIRGELISGASIQQSDLSSGRHGTGNKDKDQVQMHERSFGSHGKIEGARADA